MIERHEYLNELQKWKNEKVIKVVTGLRRCGKSTLLSMFQEQLLKSGTAKEQIISINFEDLQYETLKDYSALYRHVTERLCRDRMNYIFLDEIQMVQDFQKAVDSLYIRDNVDLYITGSNAYLLSGELATLLSGRYVEIRMLPLSFREYCELKGSGEGDALFSEYMRYGALPYIAAMDDPASKADVYLEGIYNTIIVKDIELRQQRRENDPNKRKITDMTLLRNIARFLAESVGSPVSVKSISDYITSTGRKISQNTVNDYVEALIEPYIFYPAERFDIKGKQLLKQNHKLYIVDLGLRRHLVPKRNYDLGHSLENLVYLELLRRGFTVMIGKAGSAEVDFVAKKGDNILYFQVAASLIEESTFVREFAPLKAIADNYPKTILTLDHFTPGNYDGITVANAVDWLLE
ncbi:MAG: ATP-binding protein [Oscillospiraceae bacterium]|nr:ATP-binding protein [Oscillospiraceae bacterium]